MTVEYRISTSPSKFLGYQSKSGEDGTVTLFVANLWKQGPSFEKFIDRLSCVALLERICIERAFQGIRMKNRCEPLCKMQKIADLMMYPDEWPQVRAFWENERRRVGVQA